MPPEIQCKWHHLAFALRALRVHVYQPNPALVAKRAAQSGKLRIGFMLHGVQMNEEEAGAITGIKYSDGELANQILALDTKVLHLTRGSAGSTLFIDSHKQVKRHDIPPVEPEMAVDTTGCGDVFGAAYCAYYLKSKNIPVSAKFANRVASFNAQIAGSQQIDKLSKFSIYDFTETEVSA